MHPNLLSSILALSLCVCAGARAQPDEAYEPTALPVKPSFSSKGRTLVAGSIGGHWSNNNMAARDWSISLNPSAAHFVKDRIALGVTPQYSVGSETLGLGAARFQDLGFAAYALFDVPLAQRVSLFVIPSLGYSHRWRDSSSLRQAIGASGGYVQYANKESFFRMSVSLPVAVHVSDSVVIGLGPYCTVDQRVGTPSFLYPNSRYNQGLNTYDVGVTSQRRYIYVGVSSFVGASF
ncbi:MAG: hypothetical protein JWN04_1712 [Myxococcaceae bacterium]|nr:hypothetical protein [Myxococcaceae bacterium]